ncbi:hypothetical protein, partial [Bradyrhizobium sp. CCBAU 11361]|uniref:hypothetical protein n=1 Tax=Bradyrhizobium sp. CCBAU 11361 TaxID=1630812 RepID=UPI002302F623
FCDHDGFAVRPAQILALPTYCTRSRLLSLSVRDSKALADRDESFFRLGILEAKMRSFGTSLNRPVDFALSCNARCLFAQVIQLPAGGPDNHTICHFERSLTQKFSSRCMVGRHRLPNFGQHPLQSP